MMKSKKLLRKTNIYCIRSKSCFEAIRNDDGILTPSSVCMFLCIEKYCSPDPQQITISQSVLNAIVRCKYDNVELK